MPTIELLIGMIASGKSTYARLRADQGALVIAHDDLTQMLHGAYRYEPGLRECYREMEERLATIALFHGRDVVVDRTHLTRESRTRWIDFATGRNNVVPIVRCRIVAVVFPIHEPAVHARRRVSADPRGRPYDDWLGVARHHWGQAQAEPFDQAEGFDEVIRPEVNG